MEVNRTTFRIVQGLLIGIAMVIAGFVGYVILGTDIGERSEDATRKASITRVQSSAFAYFGRLQFYDGVCSDIGITDEMNCTENGEAFAIEIPLTTGEYYCADSTGFKGVQRWSKGSRPSCTETE